MTTNLLTDVSWKQWCHGIKHCPLCSVVLFWKVGLNGIGNRRSCVSGCKSFLVDLYWEDVEIKIYNHPYLVMFERRIPSQTDVEIYREKEIYAVKMSDFSSYIKETYDRLVKVIPTIELLD